MTAILATLAASVGAPLIEKILSRRIGAGNAAIVGEIVSMIAERLGVAPTEVETIARREPDRVQDAIIDIEEAAPERLALYAQGLEVQLAALEAEAGDPVWMRAWRPLGMYMIGALWLWNVILLHVLNAIFKISLPPVDLGILFQLSALYLGLYMGGHTVKDFVAHRWGDKGGPA